MPYYRKSKVNIQPRIEFDASNVQHLKEYQEYLTIGQWHNGCRFLLEDPYLDIPTMINAKIVEKYLSQFKKKYDCL